MISLLELQRRSARAFRDGDGDALAPWLVGGARSVPRVRVYRNNLLEASRKTLASSYPVVSALVGDDCFRTLARDYVGMHPSSRGDLQRFGEHFPGFVDLLYGGSAHGYLGPVARLEWACDVVRCEHDDEPAALNLGDVAAADHPGLRFRLQNALRLVQSTYPILSIWRANQPGGDGHVDLGAGAEHVLVVRGGGDVEPFVLDAATFAFIACLRGGVPLGAAIDAGLALADAFDPGAALVLLAARGLIVDCSPSWRVV